MIRLYKGLQVVLVLHIGALICLVGRGGMHLASELLFFFVSSC